MSTGWSVAMPCTRAAAEALSDDHPAIAGIDPPPVLVASEEDEAADRWLVTAYFEAEPAAADVAAIAAALGVAGAVPRAAPLPDSDWVTLSQEGLAPVRAGRFHVHTGRDDPDDAPGVTSLRIDAGRAFGTGHHATTAGCLAALDALHRAGRRFDNVADIGTGTGLLAFAALDLWPRARAMASDIDPVSITVSADNAAANGVALGTGRGAVALVVADGADHPAIRARAPYDLVIANILAGPLIALAPALAAIAAPGATLILAGLLAGQRGAVLAACRRAGWRAVSRGGDAEWPVLVLRRRARHGWQRPPRARGGAGQPPGDFGSW